MLFNSWPFVALVIVTALVYYGLAKSESRQIFVLILASLVFYGYGQPALLTLLIASIAINAVSSYEIDQARSTPSRRAWAIAGIIANLAILATFKYAGLLVGAIAPDPQSAGGISAWLMQLPLPIGISFYTFQGISLLADTFSGDFKSQNSRISRKLHFRNTFFFISFFPQLVAGPVLKAKQFIPQIRQKYCRDIDHQYVFHCLVTGYFLKIVVADNLKDQTFWIQYPYFQNRSSLDLISLLIAYSAQIFADFAGYSLIAIGVAALLGYKLPKNFNFPYISRSIAEFWRRWHISLSSWLKEYLYYPLGGNRRGNTRTYINLIVVMFLGGLWHGAAWSFAVWGLWHGAGLAMERGAASMLRAHSSPSGTGDKDIAPQESRIKIFFQWIVVFTFVSLGWLLFELTDINEAMMFIVALASNIHKAPNPVNMLTCFLLILPVAIYHLLYLSSHNNSKLIVTLQPWLYSIMIFLIIVNAGSSEAFVYFQF